MSTLRCWTMLPSGLRPPSRPSSSRPPIRPRAGPVRTVASRTSPTRPTYLVDLDHAIIVDVEPTTAMRQAEVTAAKRMITRTMDRFDLYPARLAGDSGYGSAEMLGWLVYEHGIEPRVSVVDKSA